MYSNNLVINFQKHLKSRRECLDLGVTLYCHVSYTLGILLGNLVETLETIDQFEPVDPSFNSIESLISLSQELFLYILSNQFFQCRQEYRNLVRCFLKYIDIYSKHLVCYNQRYMLSQGKGFKAICCSLLSCVIYTGNIH